MSTSSTPIPPFAFAPPPAAEYDPVLPLLALIEHASAHRPDVLQAVVQLRRLTGRPE